MHYPIVWMPSVDHLPEFDIDFEASDTKTKFDEAAYNDLGNNADYKRPKWEYYIESPRDHIKTAKYYPGFTFIIKATRDPFSKVIRSFFPCLILAIF